MTIATTGALISWEHSEGVAVMLFYPAGEWFPSCPLDGIIINGVSASDTSALTGESTVAKILDLVENAGDKKGRTENYITCFAHYYTPAAVFADYHTL